MSKHTITQEELMAIATFYPSQDVIYPNIRVTSFGFFNVLKWDYSRVNLPEWVLHWNVNSGIVIEADGKTVIPTVDEVLLFPPFTSFSGYSKNVFCQFFIHFTAGVPFNRVRNEIIKIPADFMWALVPQLENSPNEASRDLLIYSIIMQSLQRIPEKYFLSPDKTPIDSRISRAVKMIEASPGATQNINELCGIIKMSVNNFHRRFLEDIGMTPKQYIIRARLKLARSLLIYSAKTIDEIAQETGFANRYHFSKTFKNYYLSAPATYKQRIKKLSNSTPV